MSGNLTQIVDRCDSAFVTFDNKQLEAEYRCYFAFVCSYDENYWIKVNNQEYRFS